MPRLHLTLLGGFQARTDAGPAVSLPPRKAQALLAYLALQPGRAHPRDKLAALLWGDTAEEQARASLRQALFALRKALPTGGLVSEGETLALDPAAVEVDAVAFERRAASGTPEALGEAAALYQGDLLAGLALKEAPFEEWLLGERERLRELALEGLAKLLAHQRAAGATEAAIQTGLKLLSLDPLQEAVHRTLMRLYAQAGRRGAALRQYQSCVATLQRELGVEPEAETKELYQEILRQRPAGPRLTEIVQAFPDSHPAETPLIGREAESALLRQALEAALAGHGRRAVVLGEAGVGKSRLVAELATEAAKRQALVLVGRSYESDRVLPFGPWVDAIRRGQLLNVPELVEALPKVWRAELTRLFPELADQGLSAPNDPASPLRLFEAVARLVAGAAGRRRLLLVLEDVHWADEMSLRLLSFLGRRVAMSPVLLVVTAREEEADESPLLQVLDELKREKELLALSLSPLSRDETALLVRALATTGREEATLTRLAGHVWAVSEGNPFVAVEVMRAWQDERRPAAGEPGLPERVRDLISSRLRRLGQPARELMAVVAVIGREFEFPVLQQASGLSERDTAAGLEELVRRRVVRVTGERFDFAHDRIREAAHAELLPPRRKLLHRQVAEALETVYAEHLEPHHAALAGHYEAAAVWDRAASHLRSAGLQAVSRTALRQAVAFFGRALEALRSAPESRDAVGLAIDARIELWLALYLLGELETALGALREAERLAIMLGDEPRLGRVRVRLSNHSWMVAGAPADARAAAESALAIADKLGDMALRIPATYFLAAACLVAGDHAEAEAHSRTVLRLLTGDPGREDLLLGRGYRAMAARTSLAWALAEQGEFGEALTVGREAFQAAKALDRPAPRVQTSWYLAYVHLVKGEFDRATGLLEGSAALARESELPMFLAHQLWLLGYAYACFGEAEKGVGLAEQGVERLEALGLVGFHTLGVVHLSEAWMLSGRPTEALACADRALTLARTRGQRAWEAQALRLLGQIAAGRDERESAEARYREALALAGSLGARPLQAHCRLGLGRLLRDRVEVLGAADMFRSMEMPVWLADAERELGRLA